jgi:sideroflexin-2
MRQNELIHGIDVEDENGSVVGKSRVAAITGISQVTISRIIMAAPGMLLIPVLMEKIEKQSWFKRVSILNAPFQVAMVGCFLIFMVPTACGLFPQRASLHASTIERFESDSYKDIKEKTKAKVPEKVYFNKGL